MKTVNYGIEFGLLTVQLQLDKFNPYESQLIIHLK